MKGPNMKTMNRNHLLIAGLCAFALSFGTSAFAEKGAETLVRLTKGAGPVKTETAALAAHKCGMCTDSWVSVVDKGTKGPNHLVSKVARHNCGACDTKIVTEGVGKGKKDVAIHSCKAELKPLCCASN
jgi:hypothetical protein